MSLRVDRQMEKTDTDRQAGKRAQASRQVGRQAGRQADRQADRPTTTDGAELGEPGVSVYYF